MPDRTKPVTSTSAAVPASTVKASPLAPKGAKALLHPAGEPDPTLRVPEKDIMPGGGPQIEPGSDS